VLNHSKLSKLWNHVREAEILRDGRECPAQRERKVISCYEPFFQVSQWITSSNKSNFFALALRMKLVNTLKLQWINFLNTFKATSKKTKTALSEENFWINAIEHKETQKHQAKWNKQNKNPWVTLQSLISVYFKVSSLLALLVFFRSCFESVQEVNPLKF